jgi:uncharacterized protein (DUF58 family)
MLLVDLSGSERFGAVARPKTETVAELAALLAFSAIKNNDRVGLILFSDRIERFVPPKKGKGHVMRVVAEILNAAPESRGTDLRCALDLLGHVARRKCVAFLISDFISEQAPSEPVGGGARPRATDYERALRIASARHDLIPIQVTDQREERLPDLGIVSVEDLESGELFEVDLADRKVRELFETRVAKQRAAREQLFRRLKLDHLSVYTDRDYVKPIADLFRLRQKRERHG